MKYEQWHQLCEWQNRKSNSNMIHLHRLTFVRIKTADGDYVAAGVHLPSRFI